MAEKALAIKKDKAIRSYALQSPHQLKLMANVLQKHIVDNQLAVEIVGRKYVMVEGWQFAGGLLGTMPRIVAVTDLSKENEVKWQAQAEIVELRTGKVVGTGFAVCSNKEMKKRSFDEYAVLSMAQTRAIGKAYRNVIGWVIKMAGYEATPSEEMIAVPAKAPAPEATYQKALALIAKAKSVGELKQFRDSMQKGRGAKLYNAEQREQLIRFIDDRITASIHGA